jgi:hypothetical protein
MPGCVCCHVLHSVQQQPAAATFTLTASQHFSMQQQQLVALQTIKQLHSLPASARLISAVAVWLCSTSGCHTY